MTSLRSILTNSRLREPLGVMDSRKEKLQFVVFVSVFSIFFLILFQPFGVNNYDPTHTVRPEFVLFMLIFGLVIGGVLAVNEFLLAPLFFWKRNALQLSLWTGWTLFLLSSSSFCFYNFLGGFHDWHFSSYRGFLWDVSNMEVIPIAMAYLYFYNLRAQQKLQELRAKNQSDVSRNALVHFESDNGKERFAVHWDQLLYLESQDNYVAVHYLESGARKKKLIRSTLKKLERGFAGSPLIRCHRSYMANLARVTLAEGNQRQLKLTLQGNIGPLPVSRNYVAEVNDSLGLISWVIRKDRQSQNMAIPWNGRNKKWAIILLAFLPLQFLLFATGEPHGATDEIGVALTILQAVLLPFVFVPGREVASA